MTISTLPTLFVVQIVFCLSLGYRTSAISLRATAIIAAAMSVWASLTTWLALSGVYDAECFLTLLPSLWLPSVPFIIVGLALVSPSVRRGLVELAATTPAHWLVAVQALRILAIGTLIKTFQGTFPWEVELAIGLTDLAFGLSAIWVFILVRDARIHSDALVLWHITGIALILVPGLLALQTGLPGAMQVFDRPPTSAVMLDWPMVLGPTLVVPVFLLLNLLGAAAARYAPVRSKGVTS